MNRNLLAIFTGITATAVVVQQVLAQQVGFYAEARRSVVLIENIARAGQGNLGARQGTGFIVSRDGNTYYVLTAGHVVKERRLQIRTDSGEAIGVENIFLLPGEDLALLQFTSNNQYPVARLAANASAVQALTRVYVLGYPANGSGDPESSGGNVTSRQSSNPPSGNISYNVETKPGMSGSPVLTENGEVVGVHRGLATEIDFRVGIPIEKYRELAPTIFVQAGRTNLAEGRFDQAIASIEQGRRLGLQNSPEALVTLAYAYFGQGNLDEARRTARGINGNAEASLLLAAIDYIEKNYTSAISNSSTANTLDPRNFGGYALAILGASHALNNPRDFSLANLNTTRAIQLLQNDSFVNLARSCVSINTNGDIEGARTFFNTANRVSSQRPDNPFLRVISARLQDVTRQCIPPEVSIAAVINPSPAGRYKSREPISLDAGVTALAVSSDSKFVAVGMRNGNVSIYNLQTRAIVETFSSGQIAVISSVAFSPDGRDIAVAASNGEVKVFNIQSRQQKYRLEAGSIPRVVFSDNNIFLFVGSSSGTLRMIDNRSGLVPFIEPNAQAGGINSLALSPNGSFLATGGSDGTVKLWRTQDLLPHNNYPTNQQGIESLTFSDDGSQTISADFDIVRACNIQTKQCEDIARSSQVIRGLAVSLFNGHVAYSADNKIFLEDQRNKQSLGNLSDHRNIVNALAYTPDGKYLISGSDDKTIIIWEVL